MIEQALPDHPYVAVAISVLNEAASIDALLDQLVAQDYPHDKLEVVVADGGSIDATKEIVLARTNTLPKIRLVDNKLKVPAAGFNLVIDMVACDLLMIVGGHALIPTNFVSRSVEVLTSSGAAVAGGSIATAAKSPTGNAISVAMSSRFGVGGAKFRTGATEAADVDTVPFGLYRRPIFDEVGTFDVSLVGAEDDELNFRIVRAGHRIRYDPSISSTYFCRDTFRGFARQYFGYGLGKARVIRKHKALPSLRVLVPPTLVLVTVATPVLAVTHVPVLPWLGLGGLSTYLIGAAAASVKESSSASPIKTFCSFLTIHFCYGFGFLKGTIVTK